MAIFKLNLNYDKLGVITSVACTIHCTMLPIFLGAIPFLGINILKNLWIEYVMIGLAFLFGFLSLRHGYRHHHKRKLPSLLFALGFSCLILNQFSEEQFILLLIPLAAVLIITAHSLNIWFCKIENTTHICDD